MLTIRVTQIRKMKLARCMMPGLTYLSDAH